MEAVGVEGLAGADHAVPPAETAAPTRIAVFGGEAIARASFRGYARIPRRVRVARQRVAHEDHVVALGSERAVRFVGDRDRMKLAAAVEGALGTLAGLKLHTGAASLPGIEKAVPSGSTP